MLADAHVDQTIIKKIVGHAGAMTLTERVYTHLDIHELIEAIDKIWKIGIVTCVLLKFFQQKWLTKYGHINSVCTTPFLVRCLYVT